MKEFYTEAEKILVEAAKLLEVKQLAAAALSLDPLLLEMEEQVGLMDGLKMEVWTL